MPDKSIARPTSTSGARGAAGIHKSMPVDATVQSDVAKPAKKLRPRRNGKVRGDRSRCVFGTTGVPGSHTSTAAVEHRTKATQRCYIRLFWRSFDRLLTVLGKHL